MRGAFMKKKLIRTIICCACILAFAGCGKTETTTESTQPLSLDTTYYTQTTQSPIPTQAVNVAPPTHAQETENTITQAITDMVEIIEPATVPTPSYAPEATESTTAPQTTKTYEKTGEMEFSDSADNRYIASISQKYNVPAEMLVALYTVPENDSNIVLQFDGTQNDDGTLKRNKDTLVAIYSIDKALNSKRASEDRSLNEYSYGEMKVMFFTTTNHIMPEFEELK